jgi:hypothetical protein
MARDDSALIQAIREFNEEMGRVGNEQTHRWEVRTPHSR